MSIRSSSKKYDPATWLILIYFFLFVVFYKMAPVILGALVFGWYLAMIIEVPAGYLSRIKYVTRKMAIVISAVGMFVLLAYAFIQIIPIILDEGRKIFPMIDTAAGELDFNKLFGNENISPEIVTMLQDITQKVVGKFSEFGVNILNQIVHYVPDAMTAVIIFIITATYFTALMPIIKKNLWRFFPGSTREKSIRFIGSYYKDLRHFIGGQVIIAGIVGTLVGVGAFISGVPYALFLGFLSGITNFIPFLGVIVASIPALLLAFTNVGIPGLIKMIIVLVLVNQLESWVFAPKIQGSRMKINWFAILLMILLCGTLFGVVGVLLAIPFIVFFRKFWTDYMQPFFEKL